MQANWLYVGGAVLISLSVMMLVFAAQSMLQSRNSSSAGQRCLFCLVVVHGKWFGCPLA